MQIEEKNKDISYHSCCGGEKKKKKKNFPRQSVGTKKTLIGAISNECFSPTSLFIFQNPDLCQGRDSSFDVRVERS